MKKSPNSLMRLFCFICIAITLTILAPRNGCASPPETVNSYYNALSDGDFLAAMSFLVKEDAEFLIQNTSEGAKLLTEKIWETSKWSIQETYAEGSTAKVSVKAVTPNLGKLLGFQILEDISFVHLGDGNKRNEFFQNTIDRIGGKAYESVEKNFDVNLVRIDGSWKIVYNMKDRREAISAIQNILKLIDAGNDEAAESAMRRLMETNKSSLPLQELYDRLFNDSQ